MENITTYVAQDCTVYIDDIIKLCTEDTSSRRRISVSKKEARSRASSISSASGSSAFETELAKLAIEEQLRQDLIHDKREDMGLKSSAARTRTSLLAAKAASTINLYDSSCTGQSSACSSVVNIDSGLGSEAGYNLTSAGTGSCSNIRRKSKEEKWRGVVIYIPVRLGGEKFNPIYSDCVKNLFSQPTSLGKYDSIVIEQNTN